MSTQSKPSPLGSSFGEFLRADGLHEEATLAARKRVLAMLTACEMEAEYPVERNREAENSRPKA